MDLLIPDSGLLFWMTLVFVIVFLILRKWGFPAIVQMVEERKAFIDSSLKKAHEANERLAHIEREADQLLQQARQQQAEMLKEAAQTRDAIVASAQQKAKEESARLLAEAKAEIEQERQNALRDIKSQVATLSVQVAEHIVRRQLDSDQGQTALVDQLLTEVAQGQGRS